MHSHTLAFINADIRSMPGTVDAQRMRAAVRAEHPLLTAIDSLYHMATLHTARHECKIAEDYYCGPYWLTSARATRNLFSADFGPISNGTLEGLFWRAMDVAGYKESDL